MKLGSLIESFGIHEQDDEHVDLSLPRGLFEEVEREIERAYPAAELEPLRAGGADKALRVLMWRERFRLLFMHLDDELHRDRGVGVKGEQAEGLLGEDCPRTNVLG